MSSGASTTEPKAPEDEYISMADLRFTAAQKGGAAAAATEKLLALIQRSARWRPCTRSCASSWA